MSKGEHHGPRADKGNSVQQVWSLRKARPKPTHQNVRHRGCNLRGREMGQTQKDSQPCIPSREIKGLFSFKTEDFLSNHTTKVHFFLRCHFERF